MSRRTQLVLGLALAAFFVWLFLRQTNFAEVEHALAAAHWRWVAVSVLLALFTSLERAWRWRQLLSPIAEVPIRPMLDCILMGWTVTVVLAGRLGEVARPVLLSRRTEVRASAAFGSVVLERAFDGVTVLVLLAFYLAFLPAPPTLSDEGRVVLEAMRTSGMAALAGSLVLGAGAVVAMRSQRLRVRFEAIAQRLLPTKLAGFATAFLEGMSGLGSPWLVARIAVSSLVLWSTILLSYIVMFRAFDIALPWYAAIPVLVLLVIGVMVPTPAGVGSFHKAAQIGLVGLWAVNNDVAVAYAIVSHAAAFLPLGLAGAVLLVREGLSPAMLGKLAVSAEEDPAQEV